MISIPHIEWIEEKIENVGSTEYLGAPELTEEEVEKGRRKVAEIRKQLGNKFRMKN